MGPTIAGQAAADRFGDGEGPWPTSTSIGRWLHDKAAERRAREAEDDAA